MQIVFSWRILMQQMFPPSSACDAPSWPRSSIATSGAFFGND
jgi:hypothetical protein